MFIKIEAGLVVLAAVLAFAVPKLGSRGFEALERTSGMMAERCRKRTQAFLPQNFLISTDAFRAIGG